MAAANKQRCGFVYVIHHYCEESEQMRAKGGGCGYLRWDASWPRGAWHDAQGFPGRPNDRTPGNSGDWRQTGRPRGRLDRGRVVVEEGVGHVGRDTKMRTAQWESVPAPRDLL